MSRNQVIFSYFRDELLKTLHERPFAHGAHHLHHPISVILPGRRIYRRPATRLNSLFRVALSGSKTPPRNGWVRRPRWPAAASDRKTSPQRTTAYYAAW